MKRHSERLPWPHYIDEEDKCVYVNVNGWQSALGANALVKKWLPGYDLTLVSEERLDEVEKRN